MVTRASVHSTVARLGENCGVAGVVLLPGVCSVCGGVGWGVAAVGCGAVNFVFARAPSYHTPNRKREAPV